MKFSEKKAEQSDELKSFSNDATKKILGSDYQKLFALERCLNAKKNEYIWIECKGDVADQETSFELKHHEGKHNLTSNAEDVWKTIKNYVEEFQIVKTFNSLVLYTTSGIPADSIFYKWNDLKPEDKKIKLLSHAPSKSIEDYYSKVTNCEETVLLEILTKFSIHAEQLNIKEKWDLLKEHSTFTLVQESFLDAALEMLNGYITKKAIDNANKWQICINDFQRDIKQILSSFTKSNVPFPVIPIKGVDTSKKDFLFIKKMQEVKLRENVQANAVSDYLRANKSQVKLLTMTPTLLDNLKNYDENVGRMLTDSQEQFLDDLLKSSEIENGKVEEKSRSLYFECIMKPHDGITGVDNTQKYYRDGRIHHTLENTDFKWKINSEKENI